MWATGPLGVPACHSGPDTHGCSPLARANTRGSLRRTLIIAGVIVRREGRWTTAGATPARELVRSAAAPIPNHAVSMILRGLEN
jgi:hypothetical protein